MNYFFRVHTLNYITVIRIKNEFLLIELLNIFKKSPVKNAKNRIFLISLYLKREISKIM